MTLLRLAAISYHGDPTRLAATGTVLGMSTVLPGRSVWAVAAIICPAQVHRTVLQKSLFRYNDRRQWLCRAVYADQGPSRPARGQAGRYAPLRVTAAARSWSGHYGRRD